MYGGGEEESLFGQETPAPTRNNAPIVENGLFGGNALKDDDPQNDRTESKAKLNSLFDYDDSDDDLQKKLMDRMTGAESV